MSGETSKELLKSMDAIAKYPVMQPESRKPITPEWLIENEFSQLENAFWLYVGNCYHVCWCDGKVMLSLQTLEDDMPLPGTYRTRGELWMLFDVLQLEMKRGEVT